VRDGQSLWSGKFDEKLNDILQLQDAISEQVATALAPQLTGAEKKSLTTHGTKNHEAYVLYLKGRYLWHRGNDKCRDFFDQAIALDPTYAAPYSGLSNFYTLMGLQERLPRHEAFPKGKAFAMKALDIDDTLAEAHDSLAANLLFYDWNFPEAEREVKRALTLNPNLADPWNIYSWYLRITGRLDEAVIAIRRGAELEPVSAEFGVYLARELYSARRYDEAITQSLKTLELEPNDPGAHCILANAYEQLGKLAQAAAERNKAGQISLYRRYAHDYAINGYQWTKQEELRLELARLQSAAKTEPVRPIAFARLHARLGEKDQAFFFLDKAYQERSARLLTLKSDPSFDGLRSDTRYVALLRRIGLEP
jgi:tetratricopeptide (TPR) repeat protein